MSVVIRVLVSLQAFVVVTGGGDRERRLSPTYDSWSRQDWDAAVAAATSRQSGGGLSAVVAPNPNGTVLGDTLFATDRRYYTVGS